MFCHLFCYPEIPVCMRASMLPSVWLPAFRDFGLGDADRCGWLHIFDLLWLPCTPYVVSLPVTTVIIALYLWSYTIRITNIQQWQIGRILWSRSTYLTRYDQRPLVYPMPALLFDYELGVIIIYLLSSLKPSMTTIHVTVHLLMASLSWTVDSWNPPWVHHTLLNQQRQKNKISTWRTSNHMADKAEFLTKLVHD